MRPAIAVLLASLLGLATGHSATAQEGTDFKPVEVNSLRKDLSKFWAVGFTFLDTVTESPGAFSIQVAKKSYVRFSTKSVGVCYADASLGSKLEELRPGEDFVFTATVLQDERGMFSFRRAPQYFVVAMKFQPALAEATAESFLKAGSALPDDSPDGRILKNYSTLIVGLQADLAALARTRGIETTELMKASSTNRPEVERIITTGIESLADQMEVRLPDVLGQLTMALLASQMQPATKPEPAASEQPNPASATEASDPARAKAEAEAQLKAERQRQAALAAEEATRARAAADAEKKRLAEEQAAKAAADKKARIEMEAEKKRIADEQAATKIAAEQKARAEMEAEKRRLAAERAAKVEAERQAQLERERVAAARAEAERIAREKKMREERETKEAEEKLKAVAPKMRAPSPADATLPAQETPAITPKPASPSAKIQPALPPQTPAPGKAPETPVEDYNAPMPL